MRDLSRRSFVLGACLVAAGLQVRAAPVPNAWVKADSSVPSASDAGSSNGRVPLGSNTRGDDAHVTTPCVIKDDSVYRMWYSGNDGSTWRIYSATSTDGVAWFKVDNTTAASTLDAGPMTNKIHLGSSGRGDDLQALAPWVVKDGPFSYKMWYTGTRSAGNYRIFCATSSNARVWYKVDNTIQSPTDGTSTNGSIPLGTAGKGDSFYTAYCSVIKDQDTYKMWYTGTTNALLNERQFYHATSTNGFTWTKYSNSVPAPYRSNATSDGGRLPLGSGAGRGDTTNIFTPSVLKLDATYHLWYGGTEGYTSRVYHATSPDGRNWTKTDNTVPAASDSASTAGRVPAGTTSVRGDWKNANWPCVIKDGAQLCMWYGGTDNSGVQRIYYATHAFAWPSVENGAGINTAAEEADLMGNVLATGGAPAEVYVYWGRADGQFEKSSWDTNTYLGIQSAGWLTHHVTGLLPGTNYYFRYYATNALGEDWADTAAVMQGLDWGPDIENRTPTDVTATSARLNGWLVTTGGYDTLVRVYWGPADGGDDPAAWHTNALVGTALATGAVTCLTSDTEPLPSDTTCFYRFYASNAVRSDWAAPAAAFLPGTLTVEATDATGSEQGIDPLVFTVSRLSTAGDLLVNYSMGGSAASGADYTPRRAASRSPPAA